MRPQTGQLQSLVLEPDYYSRLGVHPEATAAEIESRFVEASQGYHLNAYSDDVRFNAAEQVLVLTQAYELLSHPVERSHYDIRRFGRQDLPLHSEVQTQFKSGLAAFRQHKLGLAASHFAQAVTLYPHRSLFRVHLANVYYEQQQLQKVEQELHTALRLDPEDRFVKETVARLMFDYEHFARAPRDPFVKRFKTQMLTRLKTGNLTGDLSGDRAAAKESRENPLGNG